MEKEREREKYSSRLSRNLEERPSKPFTCSRDGMGTQRRKEYRMLTSHSDDGVRHGCARKERVKEEMKSTRGWPNSSQYQPSIQGASRKNVKIDWEKIKSSSRCRLATFQGKSSSFKCVHGRDGSCGRLSGKLCPLKKIVRRYCRREKSCMCKRRNCLYLYFALHVYNAGAFFERTLKRERKLGNALHSRRVDVRGVRSRKSNKRNERDGKGRRRRGREEHVQVIFTGVNDHRDTERRAEQQVYVKKALRSLAKRISWMRTSDRGVCQDSQEEKRTRKCLSV